MSATAHRTPKSGRQSLFLNDLASPVSSRRGKFSTPGQAAAVSALWRENFAGPDLPPPPMFTLEDRSDFSPEMGIMDYQISPEPRSETRTPGRLVASRSAGGGSGSKDLSASPLKGTSEKAITSYALVPGGSGSFLQRSGSGSGSGLSLLTPGRRGGGISGGSGSGGMEIEEKGKGSPVDGMVLPGALMTLPPPREVARPESRRNCFPAGNMDEEEWVTVYGFSPGDTNLVLREFEKCGIILKHVLGPRNGNWMHILYQSRSDAHKALSKDGMQISGVLMVGVKPVDLMQRQMLNERVNNQQGFMTLPHPSLSSESIFEPNPMRAGFKPYPQQQNGGSGNNQMPSTRVIAAPAKSVVSKVMDLMFGV